VTMMPDLFTLTSLMGIGGLILVFISSSMIVQNYFSPNQDRQRIRFHCYVGFSALLLLIIHALSIDSIIFSSDLSGTIALGLVFVVDAMGIVMRFLPNVGSFRFHSRSYHPALVLGLVISAIIHVFSKLF